MKAGQVYLASVERNEGFLHLKADKCTKLKLILLSTAKKHQKNLLLCVKLIIKTMKSFIWKVMKDCFLHSNHYINHCECA